LKQGFRKRGGRSQRAIGDSQGSQMIVKLTTILLI
jgi:hypothetical protein